MIKPCGLVCVAQPCALAVLCPVASVALLSPSAPSLVVSSCACRMPLLSRGQDSHLIEEEEAVPKGSKLS